MSKKIDKIDEILDWFDRRSDSATIRQKMKDRFAVGLKQQTAVDTDYQEIGPTWETFQRQEIASGIDAGLFETISTGIGPKIANSLAILFGEAASFQFDDETTGDAIASARDAGGFATEAKVADYIACACESSVLHMTWSDGIVYRALRPSSVHVRHAPMVSEGGTVRPSDTSSLEDAAVVAIDTGRIIDDMTLYRAYIGEASEYPNGRLVDYLAGSWEEIPRPGDPHVLYEYEDGGSVANPFTLHKQRVDPRAPEYPISIIRGGTVVTSREILPISESLYETSIELELAWSRLLKDGLEGATGKLFIKNEQNAPLPLPSGAWVPLHQGQDVESVGKGSGDAVSMIEGLKQAVIAVAAGYGVPDYHVVSYGQKGDMSGVALAIRTLPLERAIKHRKRVNSSAVARIFEIEKALLSISGESVALDSSQTWKLDTRLAPQTDESFAAELRAAREAGLISQLEAIRRFHKLETIEQAEDYAAAMSEQNERAPAPSAQRPRLTGLPPRGGQA